MKSSELKRVIREMTGNPAIRIIFPNHEKTAVIRVQKGSLLEAIDEHYPDKHAETGMYFRKDGCLMMEQYRSKNEAEGNV